LNNLCEKKTEFAKVYLLTIMSMAHGTPNLLVSLLLPILIYLKTTI